MGKSPDDVIYLLSYVTGRHFTRGCYCINLPCAISVEAYTRGVGAGRMISKRTPASLDREDHQDFVIRCRTYFNSKISDRIGISILIRSEILEFNEHSQYYALKRTRTSTLFSTRF